MSSAEANVKTWFFKEDGGIPNHPRLPVLLYKGAFSDNTERTEKLFNRHNWLNSWTNGVFDYHHYHSNAHEVLGVISGSAVVLLGGEHGEQIELKTGDVVVLPAGTGHKKLSASSDFKIVGAYPDGMEPDLHKESESVTPASREKIGSVPVPDTDPVFGEDGPLLRLWK
ncbi:cupin domain-containing protein [Paenibacillus sp. 1P03SA]|uniref:cupin domain-containing protein n=1 Tax=Paenibacillus sp. 1P03SA TaxID=3132294 RepID=UPI0039A0CB51